MGPYYRYLLVYIKVFMTQIILKRLHLLLLDNPFHTFSALKRKIICRSRCLSLSQVNQKLLVTKTKVRLLD